MSALDLVNFTVRSITSKPDYVNVVFVEGDVVNVLELSVHIDDATKLNADDEHLFRAVQKVLAASGGNVKNVLELCATVGESGTDGAEE